MQDARPQVPEDLTATHVWLPLPGGMALHLQGSKRPPGTQAVTVKDRTQRALGPQARQVMVGCAQMVRAAEPPQRAGPRDVGLELALEAHEGEGAGAKTSSDGLSSSQTEGLAWAAAAGALADRMVRGAAADWPGHVLLLAGLEVSESRQERWGTLQALGPALATQVLAALRSGPLPEPLQQALVVLPGHGRDGQAWRDALAIALPQARVITVDTLLALTGPHDVRRRPQVGETWFPLVGSKGASLHRLQVAVWPWQATRGEWPPIEVLLSPLGAPVANPHLLDRVKGLLRAVRQEEAPSARQWATVVTLPAVLLESEGRSYELALAVADRMARGREWPGAGRVLATGGVSADRGARGAVLHVGGGQGAQPGAGEPNHKLLAFWSQAQPGDTVLLPNTPHWRHEVDELRAADGASPVRRADQTRPPAPQVLFVSQVVP